MNRWLDRSDCWEGVCRVRVGYAGWLWKCYAYRRANQLKIYDVYCYSGKQVWVSRYGGILTSRTVTFVYTD